VPGPKCVDQLRIELFNLSGSLQLLSESPPLRYDAHRHKADASPQDSMTLRSSRRSSLGLLYARRETALFLPGALDNAVGIGVRA